MKWLFQRLKCWAGYHKGERVFLQRTNQRRMMFACDHCGAVTRTRLLSKSESKSVRAIHRKFRTMELHD